jgi:hypothetical protein
VRGFITFIIITLLTTTCSAESGQRIYIVSENAGVGRASELREVLQTAQVSSLQVASSARARNMASLFLTEWGLPAQIQTLDSGEDCRSLAEKLKVQNMNTLVICSPYSASLLIESLGVQPPAPPDPDELYVVIRRTSGAELRRSRFGFLPVVKRLTIDYVKGSLKERFDLSAIAVLRSGFVVAADEQASVQLLERGPSGDSLKAGEVITLAADGEVDIEGLATDDHGHLYVLGSHSHRRRNVDPLGDKSWKRKYSKNRKRFLASEIRRESSRDRIYRMSLPMVAEEEVSFINLRELLDAHPVLSPYATLPGKENGIDIEGLASDGERLYLGFRGPVFRSGFVPVLRLRYEEPDTELIFVNLAGRGVRGMARVEDGFLILAGPLGDSTLSYQLYHWDGQDCLPGQRSSVAQTVGRTTLLGTVPTPSGGKAEGLAVLGSSKEAYRVLVVFDGVEAGFLTIFEARR